jgi:hypothetical protein
MKTVIRQDCQDGDMLSTACALVSSPYSRRQWEYIIKDQANILNIRTTSRGLFPIYSLILGPQMYFQKTSNLMEKFQNLPIFTAVEIHVFKYVPYFHISKPAVSK